MSRKADRFDESRGLDSIEDVVTHRFDNSDLSEDEIMKNLQMEFKNNLHVDLTRKPEDMVYVWARTEVAGKEDIQGLMLRRSLGWTPVPRSRHPECRHMFEKSREDDDTIRAEGCILLQRHIKYHDKATEMSQKANFEAMQGISAMERIGANPAIPSSMYVGVRDNEVKFGRSKNFN